jgi:hypothetical protein
MTVRELILERQAEVRNSADLLPDRAAEILAELSSLLGNINDEIRRRDVEYNRVLLACLESEEKANRAKIRAETTPEYIAKREARDTREVSIEMIRSLKYFLTAKKDEYGLTR